MLPEVPWLSQRFVFEEGVVGSLAILKLQGPPGGGRHSPPEVYIRLLKTSCREFRFLACCFVVRYILRFKKGENQHEIHGGLAAEAPTQERGCTTEVLALRFVFQMPSPV